MAVGGEFTRRLLNDAGIGSGMHVLDIGCGTGDVSFIAVDLVGPGVMIVGIDQKRRCAGDGTGSYRRGGIAECQVRAGRSG